MNFSTKHSNVLPKIHCNEAKSASPRKNQSTHKINYPILLQPAEASVFTKTFIVSSQVSVS